MVESFAIAVILLIVGLTVCAAFANRSESRFRESRLLAIAEVGAAWCLGLIFLSGGMSKLMPFPGFIGPVWLEQELAQYGLGLFARFIAWSEAIIGLCLLLKQTRVLGAIMLVPLILNILLVTVSLGWRGTPWILAIFFAANVFLLACHYERWRPIVDFSNRWIANRRISRRSAHTLLIRNLGWGSAFAILLAPLVFKFSAVVATVMVVSGFVGLVSSESLSKFNSAVPDDS